MKREKKRKFERPTISIIPGIESDICAGSGEPSSANTTSVGGNGGGTHLDSWQFGWAKSSGLEF